MKPSLLFALALAILPHNLHADDRDDIRATYLAFVDAQNARDAGRIRSFFVNRPDFLWVSDGKAFWGVDAVIARMSSFQKAAVWRVEPDLEDARIVKLDDGSALMHLTLTVVIGAEDKPDRLPFLVSVVMSDEEEGWRISALLTAIAKP